MAGREPLLDDGDWALIEAMTKAETEPGADDAELEKLM